MKTRRSDPDLIGASPVVHARVAALFGVVVLASGSFAGFAASTLFVRGDVAATATRLLESRALFRFGLLASLVMMIAFIFYALLLYRLFERVERNHALAMLVLALVSVPIYMLGQVNQFAAFLLAPDALLEQLSLFLELHRLGNLIAGIFFGLWLLPLGWLVFKARFVPRLLGILLMVGSLGYLVLFVQAFFFPGSERGMWSNPFLIVTHVSELALLAWLLVKGVDVHAWEAAPWKTRSST